MGLFDFIEDAVEAVTEAVVRLPEIPVRGAKGIAQGAESGGEKLIESNLPSTAEVTYRKNGKGQKVLTILHYIPQRRAEGLDIVEDVIALVDVEVSVLFDGECKKVIDSATGSKINFTCENGRVHLNILRIEGFAVITLE